MRVAGQTLVVVCLLCPMIVPISGFSPLISKPERNSAFALSWSRQAWVENEGSVSSEGDRCVQGDLPDELSSPRAWLEALPNGAYSVLRCDYIRDKWFVWGRDFHLKRLCKSFQVLSTGSSERIVTDKSVLVEETDRLLDSLLSTAAQEAIPSDDSDAVFDTFMLTFLWHKETTKAKVLAHVSRLPRSDPWAYNPDPIAAAVAVATTPIPSRMPHPHAKLSSWCSQRRPLEDRFKQPSIGEVFLISEQQEILEGLTSNIFILYKDGVLRTAQDGVLLGYARHLVLKSAQRLGIPLDQKTPILLSECDQWEEVFTTSSVRLVTPVDTILVPDKEGTLQKIWSNSGNLWNIIYTDILSQVIPSGR